MQIFKRKSASLNILMKILTVKRLVSSTKAIFRHTIQINYIDTRQKKLQVYKFKDVSLQTLV